MRAIFKQRGFTLIETVLYIALFSILIVGGFATAFNLIYGSNTLETKDTSQEEALFVLKKLDWVFTGFDPTHTPTISGSGCSKSITLYKYQYSSNPITIRLNRISNINCIEIRSGTSGPYIPLTTSNIKVSCLTFSIINSVGTSPLGIAATTTINGIEYSFTKYERK